MKKLIFLWVTVAISFQTMAQSWELTPTDGYLRSGQPDLYFTGTGAIEFRGRSSNGTLAAPTATSGSRALFSAIGEGYTGSAFSDGAKMSLLTNQLWTSTARGTRIEFSTTANNTTSMLKRMTIQDDGNVAIGSLTADFPLHVISSLTTSSSTTGAFGIGLTNSFHLTMDNNQIDAWNNTAGNTLFLNYHSNAKVQVGNGSTGNLDVNGFSNLGDGAPAIKMKKLTGTTSSSSTGTATIAHGLDGTKILSIDVLVEYSTGDYVPPGYDLSGGSNFKFTYYLGGSNIYIINQTSPSIVSKPIKIIVTYEQ